MDFLLMSVVVIQQKLDFEKLVGSQLPTPNSQLLAADFLLNSGFWLLNSSSSFTLGMIPVARGGWANLKLHFWLVEEAARFSRGNPAFQAVWG
jgi:hypothetical protein